MNITVNKINCELVEGKTIIEYARELGLDSVELSKKPLAAMIGGKIFNLGYAPKHECDVRLVGFSSEFGKRVYDSTLEFVLMLAMRKLFPKHRAVVQYPLGEGVYIHINGETPLDDDDVARLKSEMRAIVDRAYHFVRRRLDIKDALEFFDRDGQTDKVKLLKWRKFNYFDTYSCPEYSDYMDYYYGELAPNSGYVNVFDLHRLGDALVMLLPSREDPSKPAKYRESPSMLAVFAQTDEWGRLMTASTVNELNRRVEDGSIRELVRVNEALHEKNYSRIADEIIKKGAKAIMIAGPSSSGKTTSANRIATQLRADGLDPIMLSLDDYYIDRDKMERDENGELDLEHINALDTDRFVKDLRILLSGGEAEIPQFSFITQRREGYVPLKLSKDQPLIIEGIHGLNPLMLGDIDPKSVFRIYVSALPTMNIDDHNRIHTSDLRLLRRLVRDHANRGASMEHTIGMWPSVRRGETRWIFPYQENADRIINTTLHYELSVMKKYIYPLLLEVPQQSEHYCAARAIVKYLNYVLEADIEDEIPPTSVIREFIGGNTFYRKD
ncbi:MAG: nucleoside kinase [Clostridia bacterium]|nr:nucleoside kinase [Clostridia bacterium]